MQYTLTAEVEDIEVGGILVLFYATRYRSLDIVGVDKKEGEQWERWISDRSDADRRLTKNDSRADLGRDSSRECGVR